MTTTTHLPMPATENTVFMWSEWLCGACCWNCANTRGQHEHSSRITSAAQRLAASRSVCAGGRNRASLQSQGEPRCDKASELLLLGQLERVRSSVPSMLACPSQSETLRTSPASAPYGSCMAQV